MASWKCAYCQQKATPHTTNNRISLNDDKRWAIIEALDCPNPECRLVTLRAFLCETETVEVIGRHGIKQGKTLQTWALQPASRARPWPHFVPAFVREDYEEACKIELLSPKASATLSRRCLQNIIRDFFGINKPKLVDEINALDGKIEGTVKDALHALREIGNIGAHPERDPNLIVNVEPDEATAMIDLLEILIEETYVAREQRNQRLARVQSIAQAKSATKKATTP
jgi:Domain of unknown function (DUF4145)